MLNALLVVLVTGLEMEDVLRWRGNFEAMPFEDHLFKVCILQTACLMYVQHSN